MIVLSASEDAQQARAALARGRPRLCAQIREPACASVRHTARVEQRRDLRAARLVLGDSAAPKPPRRTPS